jgi:hypothetical protein
VYTPNPHAGPREPPFFCTVTRNISLDETLGYRRQLRPRLYTCDPTITREDIERAFGIMAADLYFELCAGKRLLFRGHCETKPDWSYYDQRYLNMKLQVEDAMHVQDITTSIYYTIQNSEVTPLLNVVTTVVFDTVIHNAIIAMGDPTNHDNPSATEIRRLVRSVDSFTVPFASKPAFAVMYKHLLSLTPFLTPDWERMTSGKTFAVRALYANVCSNKDGFATIDINKAFWDVWTKDFSKELC